MDVEYIHKFHANFLKNSQTNKIYFKNIVKYFLISLKNDNQCF
jgi:hypothetical protein